MPATHVRQGRIRVDILLLEQLVPEALAWLEARHSVELDDAYVITPMHPWWKGQVTPEGRKLPDGFSYTSDTNTDWLSVEQLRKLTGEMHVEERRKAAVASGK
jgi:hypothetical protein